MCVQAVQCRRRQARKPLAALRPRPNAVHTSNVVCDAARIARAALWGSPRRSPPSAERSAHRAPSSAAPTPFALWHTAEPPSGLAGTTTVGWRREGPPRLCMDVPSVLSSAGLGTGPPVELGRGSLSHGFGFPGLRTKNVPFIHVGQIEESRRLQFLNAAKWKNGNGKTDRKSETKQVRFY